LQHSQRRANCEIRQAVVAINQSVDTLGDLFSKENNTTLTRLKKVSRSVNDSIEKLDSTKQTIDGFQEELQSANNNTKSVIDTLNIMQDIAHQLGLPLAQSHSQPVTLADGPVIPTQTTKTLPSMLQELESRIDQKPEKSWYEAQFASKQQCQTWAQAQQAKTQQLEQLLKQQANVIEEIKRQQNIQMSDSMIQDIADKVVQSLTRQPLFPLMMNPQPNNNP
jgi:methyl-accepting chemotaxis protein